MLLLSTLTVSLFEVRRVFGLAVESFFTIEPEASESSGFAGTIVSVNGFGWGGVLPMLPNVFRAVAAFLTGALVVIAPLSTGTFTMLSVVVSISNCKIGGTYLDFLRSLNLAVYKVSAAI